MLSLTFLKYFSLFHRYTSLLTDHLRRNSCCIVMASNPKRPGLFSLDETVFMCTNDDDPPRLDDSDDDVDVSIQKNMSKTY